MFRRSCNIDISNTDLKGVQRKLQYTYCQNKLVGCSEKLTVYISSKQTCSLFTGSYNINILKTNLWGVQKRSQYTYL